MSVIYGLRHDGEIRYVGKTTQDPTERLKKHRDTHRLEPARASRTWLRSLDDLPEIVILKDNPSDLNAAERSWIARLRQSDCRLTNLTDGGDGQSPGYRPTEDTKAKTSASLKAYLAVNPHPFKGKHHTEEHKTKMSEMMRGRPAYPMSPEGRARIAASNRRRTKRHRVI